MVMIWLLPEELPLCEVGEDGEAEKRARVWRFWWIVGCFPHGAVPLPPNSGLSAQEDLHTQQTRYVKGATSIALNRTHHVFSRKALWLQSNCEDVEVPVSNC